MGLKLKHKRTRDAMWRYARTKNKPMTLSELIDGAVLLNGTPLRESRSCAPKTPRAFGQVLHRDPRFEIVGQVYVRTLASSKRVSLWALVKDEEWYGGVR